jgi:hypothetical protein
MGEAMVKRPTCSEAELAAVVVAWLEALGADVYEEVGCAGGVADIVAKRGPELTIIETKLSWSLALVLQAMERRRSAHRVCIAAPHSRNTRDVRFLCREIGIGVLEVYIGSDVTWDPPRVDELETSRRWNSRPVALAARLRPEHKTHAKAGTVGGGRWTPFRATCEQIAWAVHSTPGITLKALVDAVKHHYKTPSSARGSIAHWIGAGKVPGVRLDPVDGLVYPAESP